MDDTDRQSWLTGPGKRRPMRRARDGYVPPAFSPELLSRMRAAATAEGVTVNSWIRRVVQQELDLRSSAEVYVFGDAEVDLRARTARRRGQPVKLGALEFAFLEYMIRNVGVAVSRSQVMTEVHGYKPVVSLERVDLLVRRLRLKLGLDIQAVPGYGYRLERSQS